MAPTPDSLYFISDLHLEQARPDLTRAFTAFLENTAVAADALFILGDLFNVWIGDDNDNDNELIDTVSAALSRLAQGGTAVYLMHGNRDFLIGDAFARRCQARLIDEPYLLHACGHSYLLVHGDSL
ncbi:MAG: UDP-2,3-diacylglucosamine diphosphatase, partial [Pseudohongiellaceae bacterium]